MKKFNPKKNDIVYVCYDGKLGRKVEGVVLINRGFAIKVRFKLWVEKEIVEQWFVRVSDEAYGAYVRQEGSLMKALMGTPGDWYSVYAKEVLDEGN